MRIKAVIFDIDGTLVDSVDLHARAWQEAFAHFGVPVEFAAVRSQIGKGGDQLMPVFLSSQQLQQFGKELEEYRGRCFREQYLPLVRAFPRVRDLFERIRADGKRITLASSAKQDELAAYKRIANIADLVEQEASSADAEQSKPQPDIIEAALRKLDSIAPREVVVVGDAPYDAEAALKAGVATVGVLSGGFESATLRSAGCIAIFRDASDILEHYRLSPLAN